MKPSRVSVIIPAARPERIPEILNGLAQQQLDSAEIEIWVICNEDELYTTEFPQTHTHFLPVPRKTKAPVRRNIGMTRATGEIFLFLDDDCIPQSNLVERHVHGHRQGHKIVGGAITFPTRPYLQLADNVSAFHDMLPFTTSGLRPYLFTANMSVHRDVVADAGPMNAELGRADDLEWTNRFRMRGYSLFFDPKAIVMHLPPRYTWRALWDHWAGDAPDTIRVRLEYAVMLRTPRLAFQRHVFLWGAIFVAMWATLRTFRNYPTWKHYWHTFPVVYYTKVAWCIGAYRHFPNSTKLGLS